MKLLTYVLFSLFEILRNMICFYLVQGGYGTSSPIIMHQMGLKPGGEVPNTIFGEPRSSIEVKIRKIEEIIPGSPSSSPLWEHDGFFHQIQIFHFIIIEYWKRIRDLYFEISQQ